MYISRKDVRLKKDAKSPCFAGETVRSAHRPRYTRRDLLPDLNEMALPHKVWRQSHSLPTNSTEEPGIRYTKHLFAG